MGSVISLVHVYGHQNRGRPASTLTPLAFLNLRLDALSEHIMAAFLLSSATRNTMAIGISDYHRILSLSIHGSPVHSNITHSIAYKIPKRWLLQHWDDWTLTHTEDWDETNLTLFKQAWETTTIHMAHFITKCIINTLTAMKTLHLQGHLTTKMFPLYGVTLETIQHLYQCNHEGSHRIWTASVDVLRKWLKAQNMEPDIAIILGNALLCIAGERNDLTQCPNLTLHSDILCIGWSSIIFGIIPTSLACTQKTYFTHTGSKKIGLK